MACGFGLTREPSAASLSGGCVTRERSVASILTGPEGAVEGAAAAASAGEGAEEAFDAFFVEEAALDGEEEPPFALQE